VSSGRENNGDPDAQNQGNANETPTWEQLLAARKVNYSVALREASLRLNGDLPSLSDINGVADANDPTTYAAMVDRYLDAQNSQALQQQMLSFWRNAFKMGDTPELDAAPLFATQLTLADRPITELFTATTGTCPTLATDGTITAANCNNGVTTHAGVLTNPGVMKHFYSNLAFRRVRWVQEVFACSQFPAEVAAPQDVGGKEKYLSPWPFDSIAGADNGGRVDFHDVSSVVCANCHSSMNHLAPLFGRFDMNGTLQASLQVELPLDGQPKAQISDWLPSGQATAWRVGKTAADLPALGALLAEDTTVQQCIVARLWNWAFGKGDIVALLTRVPADVMKTALDAFQQSGFKIKPTLKAIFNHPDFVRF